VLLKIWQNFPKKLAKLVEFTQGQKNPKFPQIFDKKTRLVRKKTKKKLPSTLVNTMSLLGSRIWLSTQKPQRDFCI